MNKKTPSARLRIAVIIRLYSRVGGGAERYCVEVTERLAQKHEVHVFTQDIKTDTHADIHFHKIQVWTEKPRFFNLWLFSWATYKLTRNNFDIVHSHAMITHANVYTLHVPCVRSTYTLGSRWKKFQSGLGALLSPRKLGYLLLEYLQLYPRKNRQFITVSELLSKNIVSNYPRLINQLTIAYPGINPSPPEKNKMLRRQAMRTSLNIPDSAFVALFVSNEFRRKGLPTILKALYELNHPDLHLIVAGAENPELMKKLATEYHLDQQIHFVGVFKKMDELYTAVNALIHPTLIDTYAMVVLEAMSHALPVIVSNADYCGFTEHLTDKEALIIKDPKNSTEIASHIERLLSDPAFSKMLSENGRIKAASITWDDTLEQTLKAYRKALPGQRIE
jgi:UDP-glucose:(heptosyl)LPS alpha-1,3-glucosyltransferase